MRRRDFVAVIGLGAAARPLRLHAQAGAPGSGASANLPVVGFLNSAGYPYQSQLGKFKVPTLRNVDKRPYQTFVKAYGHNGYFKSLEQIIHFYNTRDVPGAGWQGKPWPAPEFAPNLNTSELGNLGLSVGEERALLAFLKTLSDGYMPR